MNSNVPRIRVKVILNNSNNEILFTRMNRNYSSLNFQIPVGDVRYFEPIEASVRRIVKEQTLHEVEPIAILGIYSEHDLCRINHFVTAVFICIVTEFSNMSTNNSSDYQWLNLKRLGLNLNEEDNRILIDYKDWRVNKSTYWTSKIV